MGQPSVGRRGSVWVVSFSFVVLLLAGITGAQEGGQIVSAEAPEATMPYEQAAGASICFIDLDGSGGYYLGDSAVLSLENGCSGNSGRGQVRLAASGDQPPGKRVGAGLDQGQPLVSLSPEPLFYHHDLDGSNSLTPGDAVYLRMINPTIGTVSVGDVRITAAGGQSAGTQVRSGDADLGQAVTPLGNALERIRLVDLLDTNTFDVLDHVYLAADADATHATPGDVRILDPNDHDAYGSFVEVGDPDASTTFRAISRDPCYIDQDDNGRYNVGDPIYLALGPDCEGAARPGDVRLSTGASGSPGSRVAAADADSGRAYRALSDARIGFTGDDGTLDPGDVIILDVRGTSQVSVGDVVLTPTSRGAGFVLPGGDPLVGTPLNDLGWFRDLTVFLGANTRTTLFPSDVPYLSTQAIIGDRLIPGDIRLVPVGGHPFGGPVGIETGEIHARLLRGSAAICSPNAIDTEYLPGDPIYLRPDGPCPTSVREGLVRLVAYGDHESFTTVHVGDADEGIALLSVDSRSYGFTSAYSSNGWNDREALYLDLDSSSGVRVDVGDVRLTPLDQLTAGEAVLGEHWDRGQSLTTLGTIEALTAFVDLDGDGAFGSGDVAYITPKSTYEHVTPLSVRLTTLPAAFQAPPVSETPTPAEPGDDSTAKPSASPKAPATEAPDQELTNTTSEEPGGESPRTPGPGVALILAALAVVAWVGRRRL